MSQARVVNLYDLMDSAYDVPQIHDLSRQLGHMPLIDVHPRRNQALKEEMAAAWCVCADMPKSCAT